MVVTLDSLRDALLVRDLDDVTVYGDAETVRYQGSVHILANGRVELPNVRLLSPRAVHHADRRPVE